MQRPPSLLHDVLERSREVAERFPKRWRTTALAGTLAIAATCVFILESVHLDSFADINLALFGIALAFPPVALESALAICLGWLFFGDPRWGRWAAAFFLSAVATDFIGVLCLAPMQSDIVTAFTMSLSFLLSGGLKAVCGLSSALLSDFSLVP
jgi:hypothetical protein